MTTSTEAKHLVAGDVQNVFSTNLMKRIICIQSQRIVSSCKVFADKWTQAWQLSALVTQGATSALAPGKEPGLSADSAHMTHVLFKGLAQANRICNLYLNVNTVQCIIDDILERIHPWTTSID